jgi:hypothetical protein
LGFVKRSDDKLEVNFILGEVITQIRVRNDADHTTDFHVHGNESTNTVYVVIDLEARHLAASGFLPLTRPKKGT